MCRVEFLLGRLGEKYIMCIMLVLGGESFFIGGALVGRIGSGDRRLEFIGILLIVVEFLL